MDQRPTQSSDGLVSTLLTLLFLPVFFVAWFRVKEPRKEPEPRIGARVPAAAK